MKEKRNIPKRSEWLCTVLEALPDKALASFWAHRTSPKPLFVYSRAQLLPGNKLRGGEFPGRSAMSHSASI